MNPSDPMPSPPADLHAALRTRLAQQEHELQTLRSGVDYLKAALEITGVSLWDWDIRSGAVSRPFQLVPRDELGPYSFGSSYPEFLQAIHADDRPAVEK